jgi:hypothetical protein
MKLVALLIVSCISTSALSAAPKYIKQPHAQILLAWLSKHSTYLVATDSDCNCTDDISRTAAGYDGDPDLFVREYHPYYTFGDFSGRGLESFAVGLLKKNDPKKSVSIAIFDGPWDGTSRAAPAMLIKDALRLGQGMFYFPKRHRPLLIYGSFEADGGCSLEYKAGKYYLDCSDDE